MNGDFDKAKALKEIATELRAMCAAVDRLFKDVAKASSKTKAVKKKKAIAKKSRALSPTDQVLAIMKRFKKGISVEALRGKSGFTEKQISNIVHRAMKKGTIKSLKRGVYKYRG